MTATRQTDPTPARPGVASLADPPVLISSLAALLAGALIGGAEALSHATWGIAIAGTTLVASSRLFAGYYDRDRDARDHPERPLPSGAVRPKSVYAIAWLLLVIGLAICATLGRTTAAAGLTTALLHSLHSTWLRRVWGVNYL